MSTPIMKIVLTWRLCQDHWGLRDPHIFLPAPNERIGLAIRNYINS